MVEETKYSNVLKNYFDKISSVSIEFVNRAIQEEFGICKYFDSQNELDLFLSLLNEGAHFDGSNKGREEYGDFQTNTQLSDAICQILAERGVIPEVVVEPTCGKGNFLVSVLKYFPNISSLYGIEIYKPYVEQSKYSVLKFLLENPVKHKTKINVINGDVFNFNFSEIAKEHKGRNILIIGNPPWVTNAKLSVLDSSNLPKKVNFKNHNGIDAITGKGNFDIGEYVSFRMLNYFSELDGYFAFILKNSVIKNLIYDQLNNKYLINSIERYGINAKKEFNAAVEASVMFCGLGKSHDLIATEFSSFKKENTKRFGWIGNKFVSDINKYDKYKHFDGESQLEWRQGVKHDCAKVMELERINGFFKNGHDDKIELEKDLIYALYKSSDLKNITEPEPRKYTIITQNKIGQDTAYITREYPKTYRYLLKYVDEFKKRKSSIYSGKPIFSIFGIGDYSFKPYKVAISGLYKNTCFSLLLPFNNKPAMLDDTCYFLGFDSLDFAKITHHLLNMKKTQYFLESIIFFDSKRAITKDVLMRIDLLKLAKQTSLNEIDSVISEETWNQYIQYLTPKEKLQEELLLI